MQLLNLALPIFEVFIQILLNGNLSLNQTLLTFLRHYITLCETNLDDTTDSGNFSVKDYLSIIQKDSVTHIHVLTVYLKEGLPFAQDLHLENYVDFYLCFHVYAQVLMLFHQT